MRINTNVSALMAQQNILRTEAATQSSMAKLSSGFRITKAGDDAAGLSIANSLRTEVRSLTKAGQNIEQANSMLSIAEGAASTIERLVERAKELAVQASSDTNESQRVTLDSEYQDIIAEVDRVVNATTFQGAALIDGSFAGQTLQIGAGNSTDEQLTINIGDLKAATIGLNSDLTTAANARAVLDKIDDASTGALDKVNTVLSDIGAYQNRLGFALDNVKTAIVNISATESTIRDVDMAAEMSTFSKNQILAQAGTAMLAQANAESQNVLQLLRG